MVAWEIDVDKFGVGDEYVGSRDDIKSFILAVYDAGGTVLMTSHDTVRITDLPAPSKVEAPKKPQLPSPFVLKEVK